MDKDESRSTSFPDVCSYLIRTRLNRQFAKRWRTAGSSGRAATKSVLALSLAFILAIILGSAKMAHAQISPGPLARAHHDLDGPANCTKCHAASVRSRSFRCTECHREIAAELSQHKGLHSTFPSTGERDSQCAKCHSDHNGEDFALVHWEPTAKGFDHAKTGYILDGKHVGVACRTCHTAQHIPASARGLLHAKDLNHTYLGLTPQCATCHEDKHQGRFGSDCTQCHNTSDWKNARIDEHTFDHSRTHYPLTGMHREVECARCHKADSDGKPRYAGTPFATCATCHVDPHKGEFKQDCASCHTTATWKKSGFVSTFDHSKTAFPLLGKHKDVNCIACHKNPDFKIPIPHALCSDCHKPDPHNGQFARRPDGGKCESCHTVDGWHPSTFTIADHARTQFPLVAPHARVECARCHVPAGPKTVYRMAFAKCIDCHKDEHDGQFAAAPWSNRCQQCHTGMTWKKSNYTLAMHQKGAFPLTGSHMAVACVDCHKPAEGSKLVLYHFSKVDCTTCHEDIHHAEFAARMAALSPSSHKPLGCEACHVTKDWHDLGNFDHGTTKFALAGSHRAVACAECHKPPNLERTMLHVHFDQASNKCSDCHQNPHADQFAERAFECESCHNSNKWKPSLFDHEKTAFSLKGGHQDVACGACHTISRQVNGETVLFYKPTPRACSDCHSNGVPKATSSRISWPQFVLPQSHAVLGS